jgi:hypothetical protein
MSDPPRRVRLLALHARRPVLALITCSPVAAPPPVMFPLLETLLPVAALFCVAAGPAVNNSRGGCAAALQDACGASRHSVFTCAQCAGDNQQQLRAAGCTNDDISAWVRPCSAFPSSFVASALGRGQASCFVS